MATIGYFLTINNILEELKLSFIYKSKNNEKENNYKNDMHPKS
jgi:hypothetical protein